MIEQTELILNYEDKITKIATLKKSKTPLISKVIIDEYTQKAQDNFDYDFDGTVTFFPYEFPEILKTLEFNILVITGASGSGKSTFSKYFGVEEKIWWNNEKSIISNFNDVDVDEAVEKLISVGLNSIPTWTKPRKVLSVGEGFRADLARKIKSNAVIDEFTSTVDRDVALSTSKSISKYIKRKNLKKIVFVSCHKDFIDMLEPDYVIDLDDEAIFDTRRLPRQEIKIQIFQTNAKREIWHIFRQHHYLSHELNVAANIYTAFWKNKLVAMCAVLPQPGVANGQAWRVHRIVVLPDFQGLGIGTRLLNMIGDLYTYYQKILYIRTSHVKFIDYLLHSKKWYGDGKLKLSQAEAGLLKNRKIITNRKSASFKYINKCEYNENYNYNAIVFPEQIKNDDNIETFSIFDYIKD